MMRRRRREPCQGGWTCWGPIPTNSDPGNILGTEARPRLGSKMMFSCVWFALMSVEWLFCLQHRFWLTSVSLVRWLTVLWLWIPQLANPEVLVLSPSKTLAVLKQFRQQDLTFWMANRYQAIIINVDWDKLIIMLYTSYMRGTEKTHYKAI